MRLGRTRGGLGRPARFAIGVALVAALVGCTSSGSSGSSGAAAQSATTSAIAPPIKSPTWGAGYWVGHERTLDLAPNGVGLLVISLTGGSVGPYATIQLHVIIAGPNQATVVIDSSDDAKTVVGSTHIIRYDGGADVITIDLDQQTQNFCGVTAAPGTCGA
jgi:hypothetical protein